MDYFKEEYLLEGISWCLHNQGASPSIRRAEYKEGAPLYFKFNADNQSVCVFKSGTLLGFLNEVDPDKFSDSDELSGRIESVLDPREYGASGYALTVKISVTNKPKHTKKNTSKALRANNPVSNQKPAEASQKKVTPIRKPSSPRAKHPILRISFRKQSELDDVIRKQYGKSGIYCIWTRDHKSYIGQSKDIGARWRSHIRELKAGTHHNHGLNAVWRVKGESEFCFHVIEYASSDKLDELEARYIRDYQTYEYGYNNTPDGQGEVESASGSAVVNIEDVNMDESLDKCTRYSAFALMELRLLQKKRQTARFSRYVRK